MNRSHGLTKAPEYNRWADMKSRCYYPRNKSYKDYGGRGISVCDRWRNSFENFYNDMGNRPSKLHSLDRIDVNGNYEPSNCRWTTRKEQANNKRCNVRISHNGETKTIREWADALGFTYLTIYQRIRVRNRNWTIERAFHKKPGNNGKIKPINNK